MRETTAAEASFIEHAIAFVKANKTRLSAHITDTTRHPRETEPVSVFMAGSPGAGKTETARAYAAQFSQQGDEVLRIDPDDYRSLIPGYNGKNSWMVQPAVSILVERVIDKALSQRQSFILDGTFSNAQTSVSNIERCFSRGRVVQILYVYQLPHLAWSFVVAREAAEGRNIPFHRFAEQFISAQAAVQGAIDRFGDQIRVEVLVKPIDKERVLHHSNVKRLADVVTESFTREDIYKACCQELS